MKVHEVNVDDSIGCLVVISDSHAVYEALVGLDQKLATLPGQWRMFFAGDMFHGGVDAVETLNWLRTHAEGGIIRGNHDAITAIQPKPDDGNRPGTDGAALAALSPEGYEFTQQLPEQLNISWRGKKIRIMHGQLAPDGQTEVSWLATPKELMKVFGDPAFDLTISGHTHYAFVRREGNRFIANAGSTTWPVVSVVMQDGSVHSQAGDEPPADGGDFRSSFLVVTEQSGELAVEVVRFGYDQQGLLARLAKIEGLSVPVEYWRNLFATGVADFRTRP